MYCNCLAFRTQLGSKIGPITPSIPSLQKCSQSFKLYSWWLVFLESDRRYLSHTKRPNLGNNLKYCIFCVFCNFPSTSEKAQKVKQELTREDAHWAGSFYWPTILQPGDGRKRDARSLATQSDWVLHYNTHIFWHLYLTNYTRWYWTEGEWGKGTERLCKLLGLAVTLQNEDLWLRKKIHTMYTDVMLAVSLSCHINSDTGIASRVWHLSIFNLQQPPLI